MPSVAAMAYGLRSSVALRSPACQLEKRVNGSFSLQRTKTAGTYSITNDGMSHHGRCRKQREVAERRKGGRREKTDKPRKSARENNSERTAVSQAATDPIPADTAADPVTANTTIERTVTVEEVVLVEAVVVVAALEAALAEAALAVAVPTAVPTAEDTVSVVPSAEAITLDVALAAADAVTETAATAEDGRVRLLLCFPGGVIKVSVRSVRLLLCGPGGSSGASA